MKSLKKHLLLAYILFFTCCLIAQVPEAKIHGDVVIQNSKFDSGETKYLAGVRISTPTGSLTSSDSKGKFELEYIGKAIGDTAKIHAIKRGYAVVNFKELEEAAIVGRITRLRIVMCDSLALEENRARYYEVSDSIGKAILQERIAILQEDGRRKDSLIQSLAKTFQKSDLTDEDALVLLEREHKALIQKLDKIAEQFVYVNLDDQSEGYLEAHQAFLNYDLAKTKTLLKTLTDATYWESLQTRKKKDEADLEVIRKEEEQLKRGLRFYITLGVLSYDADQAIESYQRLLAYDSTDALVRLEFIRLLLDYERQEEAIIQIKVLMAQVPIDDVRGTYLNSLGELYKNRHQPDSASLYFKESESIYRSLVITKPEAKLKLAGTLLRQGELLGSRKNWSGKNWDVKKYDEAEKKFEEAELWLDSLLLAGMSGRAAQLEEKARLLNSWGLMHLEQRNVKEALPHFRAALEIYRFWVEEGQKKYLRLLAEVHNNLGILFNLQLDYRSSQAHFKRALNAYEKLNVEKRDAYLLPIIRLRNNLGELALDMRDQQSAKTHLDSALLVLTWLQDRYPSSHLDIEAAVLQNLGEYHRQLQDFERAADTSQAALNILFELEQRKPGFYSEQLVQAYFNFALICHDLQQWDRVDDTLTIAWKRLEILAAKDHNIKYSTLSGRMLYLWGVALLQLDKCDLAKTKFVDASEVWDFLYREDPRLYRLQRARNIRLTSEAWMCLQELDEAAEILLKSITELKRVWSSLLDGEKRELAKQLHQFGLIDYEKQEYDKANSAFLEAERIWAQLENETAAEQYDWARNCEYIGLSNYRMQDYDVAIQYLKKSISSYEAQPLEVLSQREIRMLIRVYDNLAVIHQKRKGWDMAIPVKLKEIRIWRFLFEEDKKSHYHRLQRSLLDLAEIYNGKILQCGTLEDTASGLKYLQEIRMLCTNKRKEAIQERVDSLYTFFESLTETRLQVYCHLDEIEQILGAIKKYPEYGRARIESITEIIAQRKIIYDLLRTTGHANQLAEAYRWLITEHLHHSHQEQGAIVASQNLVAKAQEALKYHPVIKACVALPDLFYQSWKQNLKWKYFKHLRWTAADWESFSDIYMKERKNLINNKQVALHKKSYHQRVTKYIEHLKHKGTKHLDL